MAYKILIADDEDDVKTVLELFLRSKGYEVATAFDGLDTIDQTMALMPDLLLLDVMMPVLDGFEVCKKLKANPETKDIPIVMLSAASHSAAIRKGLDAGAVDYLIKPFEMEQLEAMIRSILNQDTAP